MCSSPLKGFEYGVTKNGKPNYIITPYSVDHVEISANGTITRCYDSFISDSARYYVRSYIEIPCGHCIECKLEYSRMWADRCMLEAQDHDQNCFITLTYDDQNIPLVDGVDPESGEIVKYKTLDKKDLQKFIKRLRNYLDRKVEMPVKIRFFAAGEYGKETLRPHLHLIIFGWKPPESDLHLLKMSNLGYAYYYSDLIMELWPYGNNIVAECSWQTCAYVARYCVKKYSSEIPIYGDQTGIQREFVTMSRKPGIGLNWLNSHKESYATFLNYYLCIPDGSQKIGKNRYFDSKIEEESPALFEDMKKIREHYAKERKKLEYFQSDRPYIERQEIKGRSIEKRTKVLERSSI